MHNLVVSALQESRVDGAERLHAFGGQSGREGDGMLLGDADIEATIRKLLLEKIDACARAHSGGDGDDAVVLTCGSDQAFAEHLRIAWRADLRLVLLARSEIEGNNA